MNDEVLTCNAEQSALIFCYVEGRPTNGNVDPSGFKHAITTFDKVTGNLRRSIKIDQMHLGTDLSIQYYLNGVKNIEVIDNSGSTLVYISGYM